MTAGTALIAMGTGASVDIARPLVFIGGGSSVRSGFDAPGVPAIEIGRAAQLSTLGMNFFVVVNEQSAVTTAGSLLAFGAGSTLTDYGTANFGLVHLDKSRLTTGGEVVVLDPGATVAVTRPLVIATDTALDIGRGAPGTPSLVTIGTGAWLDHAQRESPAPLVMLMGVADVASVATTGGLVVLGDDAALTSDRTSTFAATASAIATPA